MESKTSFVPTPVSVKFEQPSPFPCIRLPPGRARPLYAVSSYFKSQLRFLVALHLFWQFDKHTRPIIKKPRLVGSLVNSWRLNCSASNTQRYSTIPLPFFSFQLPHSHLKKNCFGGSISSVAEETRDRVLSSF